MITLAVSPPLVLQGTMNNHLMFIFSTYSLTTLIFLVWKSDFLQFPQICAEILLQVAHLAASF